MPKTRIEVLRQVEQAFLGAESAAETSALSTSECVATMLRARTIGKMNHNVAYDAFDLISDAARLQLQARQNLVKAHDILAAVPDQLGILGFGADKHDTPNAPKFFTAAELEERVVARRVA